MQSFEQFTEADLSAQYGPGGQKLGTFQPITTTGTMAGAQYAPGGPGDAMVPDIKGQIKGNLDHMPPEDKLLLFQYLMRYTKWWYKIISSYDPKWDNRETPDAGDKSSIWMQIQLSQLNRGTSGQVGVTRVGAAVWEENIYISQAVIVGWDKDLLDTKKYTDEDLIRMGVVWERSGSHGPFHDKRNKILGVRRPDLPSASGGTSRLNVPSVQQILEPEPVADIDYHDDPLAPGPIGDFEEYAAKFDHNTDDVNLGPPADPTLPWEPEKIVKYLKTLRKAFDGGERKKEEKLKKFDPKLKAEQDEKWFMAVDTTKKGKLDGRSLIPDSQYRQAYGDKDAATGGIRAGDLREGDTPPRE